MVEPVRAWSQELEEAAARLLPQLSPRTPPDRAALEELLADPHATLLAATVGGEIVGIAVMAMHRKLTHLTARLEDVVVDERARGQGVGAALTEAAMQEALRRGAPEIELRTAPRREAANRLYQRLGFRPYDSNVYVRDLVAHPPNQGLQITDVLTRLAEAGGPKLEQVEQMGQGDTGAWLVRWPDGRPGVLTWAPPAKPGAPGGLDRALTLADVAWRAGLPAPRYQAVIPLRKGDVVMIQEPAPGVPVSATPGPGLIDHVLELAERRRGLLRGHRLAYERTSLGLREDGPGYCLHGPLADHDARTRALLERIEEIGAAPGADVLGGEDLVHFDYHLGNVLVDSEDPDRVTAIVDWGGARGGDVALDLAVLAFDVSRRAPDLAARVERRLLDTTDEADLRRFWAHAALRMVDWSLRHHPEHVDHWLAVAPRYL